MYWCSFSLLCVYDCDVSWVTPCVNAVFCGRVGYSSEYVQSCPPCSLIFHCVWLLDVLYVSSWSTSLCLIHKCTIILHGLTVAVSFWLACCFVMLMDAPSFRCVDDCPARYEWCRFASSALPVFRVLTVTHPTSVIVTVASQCLALRKRPNKWYAFHRSNNLLIYRYLLSAFLTVISCRYWLVSYQKVNCVIISTLSALSRLAPLLSSVPSSLVLNLHEPCYVIIVLKPG